MVKRKKIKLKLDNRVYARQSIHKSVSAFAQFASFAITKSKSHTYVEIKNILPEVKNVLVDEFCNYCLGTA